MIIRVSILSMVAQAAHDAAAYPSRFFGAPERGRRIGRVLRLVARVRSLDEDLIDRIGRRMYSRDELGAQLVRAMRRDRADGERVRMAQFHQALEHGIESVPDAPEPLRKFFAEVDQVPDWVDFDLLERGARAVRRMGRPADALRVYDGARQSLDRSLGQHPVRANLLAAMGDLYAAQENQDRARSVWREGLNILTATYGADDARVRQFREQRRR